MPPATSAGSSPPGQSQSLHLSCSTLACRTDPLVMAADEPGKEPGNEPAKKMSTLPPELCLMIAEESIDDNHFGRAVRLRGDEMEEEYPLLRVSKAWRFYQMEALAKNFILEAEIQPDSVMIGWISLPLNGVQGINQGSAGHLLRYARELEVTVSAAFNPSGNSHNESLLGCLSIIDALAQHGKLVHVMLDFEYLGTGAPPTWDERARTMKRYVSLWGLLEGFFFMFRTRNQEFHDWFDEFSHRSCSYEHHPELYRTKHVRCTHDGLPTDAKALCSVMNLQQSLREAGHEARAQDLDHVIVNLTRSVMSFRRFD
ncbi:uncharacterized protein IWZ02DRAFT_295458 [Phyllosticta citriasiana]|uniref:uncharacterized protein n=1 Tax=Phyllosticta citriasiana TaxID=595635 RepID=UPI0030FD76FF